MTEVEAFDVSLFQPIRFGQGQDKADDITTKINELHNQTLFIFSLLKAFECGISNDYLLKKTIHVLNDDISQNWIRKDFWSNEFRFEIIQKLFEILNQLEKPMLGKFALCFEPIFKQPLYQDVNFTPKLLQNILNSPNNSVNKLLKILSDKCPESIEPLIPNILSFINENINVKQLNFNDFSHWFKLIESVIKSINDQPELLCAYFKKIQPFLSSSFQLSPSLKNDQALFPFYDYFKLISAFTMHIPQHPVEFYHFFNEIYEIYQQHPIILNYIIQYNNYIRNNTSLGPFIQSIYPLIADDSFGDDPKFKESFKATILQLYTLLEEKKMQVYTDKGYLLLGMAAFVERFGVGDETQQFFDFAISTLQNIFHPIDYCDPDTHHINIQGCIIFLSSLSRVDPTYSGFATLTKIYGLLSFIINVINKRYLHNLRIYKMGIY